jgi:endonuclease/exonuclease/phosphatase family metal-dependent hydrolase
MKMYLGAALFAGVAMLSAAGSGNGDVRHHIDPPAQTAARAATDPLSVMTYNVEGLPWPVATGRDAALGRIADRLAAMRGAGRQPHIVLLQEAFTAEAAQIARRAGYPHVAFGAGTALRSPIAPTAADRAFVDAARWDRGERLDKQFGSGLIILSDYPITAVDRLAFPDFACAGFDCLANKGVLLAHVRVPGIADPVPIANTHLNARNASGVPHERSGRAYARQVELMAAFLRRHVAQDAPLLIGGDMNIGKDEERAHIFFAGFARAGLGFVRPHLSGLHRAFGEAVWADGRTRDDMKFSIQRRKDWLFARGAGGMPMPVALAHMPFGSEPDGEPLSDHFGYVIDYTPPRSPPAVLAGADARAIARRVG